METDWRPDPYVERAVPQFVQNFAPAGFSCPHFGQMTVAGLRSVPQFGQNFEPAGICAWQFGQVMVAAAGEPAASGVSDGGDCGAGVGAKASRMA